MKKGKTIKDINFKMFVMSKIYQPGDDFHNYNHNNRVEIIGQDDNNLYFRSQVGKKIKHWAYVTIPKSEFVAKPPMQVVENSGLTEISENVQENVTDTEEI